jgi:hypothetical protein
MSHAEIAAIQAAAGETPPPFDFTVPAEPATLSRSL